jgi:hypothetical protein
MPKRSIQTPAVSAVSSLSDGPTCLDDVLDLAKTYGKLLAQKCPPTLKVFSEDGIVITSSYSGTGGFEISASEVFESASENAGVQGIPITFYSATESSPIARAALMSHSGKTRPRHIFGDLCDRVPPECKFRTPQG